MLLGGRGLAKCDTPYKYFERIYGNRVTQGGVGQKCKILRDVIYGPPKGFRTDFVEKKINNVLTTGSILVVVGYDSLRPKTLFPIGDSEDPRTNFS